MSKKGVSAVSGNIAPVVGEEYTYHIAGWYPDTSASERKPDQVTWELFRKRSDGRFTSTHIKKKGISTFTFGEGSLGHTYRLEGYLHEPEGGGLIITPKRNKIPKITKVDLLYVDDTPGSTFSFMEKLRARAYCTNMFNKEVLFTLWEDDAKGSGHNGSNKAIDTKKSRVNENGVAAAEFMLTKALMQKAMQGEADAKQLEFYVTVEYYKNKKHATDNVEVNNPFPQPQKPKAPTPSTKPKPTAPPKAKGSPAETKPASKKEEKGIGDRIAEIGKELWDWFETQGTVIKDKLPTIEKPEGKSPAVVKEQKQEEKEDKEKLIIFPLLVKPENDKENKWGKTRNWTAKQGANMTTFNAGRDHGKRKHAARDLYTNPLEPVVAIADGIVLEVRAFYCQTNQVSIRHTLKDGRDFIIRYGELDPKSIKVKKGDEVTQKQELGKTGKLLKYVKKTNKYVPLMKIGNDIVFMLHFEHFTGSYGFDVDKSPLSNDTKPYSRRGDLIDSLAILQEGYKNSFGKKIEIDHRVEREFTEHDARLALMKIYDLYGKEMAQTIESIYRWECKHFKSKQYKNCGAPGMEVSGDKPAPNYGWDGSLYKEHPEYTPVGLWESFENKGKSGAGGNAQVTDRKKKYIKFPSVEAGMMYIVHFIKRYDGNVGRWHSLDPTIQQNYKKDIKTAVPRIVNSF